MKILVCMKQVIEGKSVVFGENYSLDRDKLPQGINPTDCAALELALQLREKQGGEITVLTMGRPQAENLLREVAARLPDHLVLVSDPMYGGSDTLATARVLAAAVRKLGEFDLILAGRRAIDGETGHIGPELAAMLSLPCLTNVMSAETGGEGKTLGVVRLLEDKIQKIEIPLPLVLTLCGGANTLRPASLTGLRKAKEAEIFLLSNDDLRLSKGDVGFDGSPTKVRDLKAPERSRKQTKFYTDVNEGVRAVREILEKVDQLGSCTTSDSPTRPVQQALHHDSSNRPFGLHGVYALEEDHDSLQAAAQLIGHAKQSGCKIAALLVGYGENSALKLLQEAGADELYILRGAESGNDGSVAEVVREAMDQIAFASLVFPATIRGRAVAPLCAAQKSLGLSADCTSIAYREDGSLLQIRPAFGGTLMAEIECTSWPQLASVRPGVYPDPEQAQGPCRIKTLSFRPQAKSMKFLDEQIQEHDSLSDAVGIVAGGKSVGKDGFPLLKRLANRLDFALGASRAAVDDGVAPYDAQIGQTGAIVRPDVYLAFGISGAVQHIAGMKDAAFVVAVNPDKRAPIFDWADVGILCDWKPVAEKLLKEGYAEP